jgi:hypothetical protein
MTIHKAPPATSGAEAIGLLAGNGNLVKRPFLLAGEGGLAGFTEKEREAFFSCLQARPDRPAGDLRSASLARALEKAARISGAPL